MTDTFRAQSDGHSDLVRPMTSTAHRDLQLSALALLAQDVGYQAMQAHALGAIDNRPLQSMPTRQREFLRQQAEQFVMGVNDYRRDRARRLATITARKWMESFALAIETIWCDQPTAVRNAVHKALEKFIDDMCSGTADTNLIKQILLEYADGLTRPLPQDVPRG